MFRYARSVMCEKVETHPKTKAHRKPGYRFTARLAVSSLSHRTKEIVNFVQLSVVIKDEIKMCKHKLTQAHECWLHGRGTKERKKIQ